jgi:hypothetical protein
MHILKRVNSINLKRRFWAASASSAKPLSNHSQSRAPSGKKISMKGMFGICTLLTLFMFGAPALGTAATPVKHFVILQGTCSGATYN